MPAVNRRASITCRLEDAFEYVANWKNFSNYIPMYVDIEPTSAVQYGPGTSLDMTIILGTKVEMKTALDIVEFQKNRKIVFKSFRGLKTRTVWDFRDIGGKVLISVSFEFALPNGLTMKDEERDSLTRDIESSWGRSLELLKWLLEAAPRSEN
jgi:hypothetical protein